MDNNKFNNWVEDVLNSTEGGVRANAPDGLLRKLEQRINKVAEVRIIPLHWVTAAAACVLLLLTINIYTAKKHTAIPHGQADQMSELVRYYDIMNDDETAGL